MGRIFLGLCQVGAWGCFDEFNRLEERILSAVSQQIQTIQSGLRSSLNSSVATVSLLGRTVSLNSSTGIFITMNPGYAGRSNLPDNLKKLFRSIAMTHPDRQLIAQVTFFAQGFSSAPNLANRIVPFFDACTQQMSAQAHYDFGLRALKSVLLTCGSIKRRKLAEVSAESVNADWEAELVLQSLSATIAPKLVGQDADILVSISETVFPGVRAVTEDFTALRQAISHSALASHLIATDRWILKVTQIYQIQSIHHGFMLVGPAATGKSASRKTLLAAMDSMDGVETITYVIDAKVLSKEALYGRLDTTTREWSDGLFTSILRKIVDNFRGEDSRRYWIVFDGDIDPVWVENMNSMLDDNKLLTLPTGERLALPDNVRLVFEVESLKYATLATVSRCGMVYFDEQSITVDMQWQAFLESFKSVASDRSVDEELGMQHRMRNLVVNCLSANSQESKLQTVLIYAAKLSHIMEFTTARVLENLFGLLQSMCNDLVQWNLAHADFPLSDEQCASFIGKQFVLSLLWGFGGDCGTNERHELAAFLAETFPEACIPALQSLVNLNAELPSGTWVEWSRRVALVDIDPSAVDATDLVIPTTDTVRNEDRLYSWLSQRKPVILCGPPGSGKTMSLTKALNQLPHCEQIGLNFSSASTPELIQRTLEQYCVYRKTPKGVTMLPKNEGQWLVMFCDEINLPARDTYGTQRIISFLRQLIEQSGFWRAADQTWVAIERIQFVGACNPPTDVGRTPFSQRFLRHAPVLMVDYPQAESLSQIYGTFVRAVLKFVPTLKGYSDAITAAMISVFDQSRSHFTTSKQSHYIYSPRELSRWMRGIAETLRITEDMNLEGLVRIWAHEALRLFADRLVTSEEHDWTVQLIRRVAQTHFPNLDEHEALAAPILYSNWLSKEYRSVNVEEMRFYIKARLKTFCEEEVDTALVLYDDAVDHVLRIDRVFRQSQGHLILIGVSGSGKTTLARFVAWMNGLKTYQIKIHRKYSGDDFDDDLRHVLRRCGTNGEKICFILNEANMLESGFLERMNTLLANANVPGLFEGDEYTTLMTACKQGSQREGLMLDSHDELYDWFTKQIARNLHVVFTMNPPQDLSASAATSPALFNRCVLNWFGDWSPTTLFQMCFNSMSSLDLEKTDYALPASAQPHLFTEIPEGSFRHATVSALVSLHLHAIKVNAQHACTSIITPRQFLDLVHQTLSLHEEKRRELEDSQRHLNTGLQKLQSTVAQVARLKRSLAEKRGELAEKNALANEKLQRMVTEQQQAEAEKVALLEIQTDLANTDKNVEAQRRIVVDDLAHAEPAVTEAQHAVSNIKRELLNEVRSLNNPPESVKLAMEAVCVLLGHQVESWRTVQTLMRRDTFIKDILKFDNETQMSPELRQTIRSNYMSQPAFQYESVNRASKACGPLVQWVVAQVAYSDILDKVGPLREQVAKLEHEAMMSRKKAAGMSQMIEEVECSIARYKDEYAALISEVQIIKQEMAQVERKVERSTNLLDSLSSEQERWSGSSASFQGRLKTLLGDAVLCAALISYAGYYDQVKREHLMDGWQQILVSFDIASQHDTRVSDILIAPEKRLAWEADGLPSDQLCAENALILERAQRYPLIIDPSDQAVNFLIKHHKDRKLVVTSFLDDSFIKQLETCVRFGSTILIRDAEKLDPIVNKLLNKEYQRTGGRTLVELGKQDVDVSPSFRMYLSTRDSTAVFGPDICSKVAFVNFTITKSSLRSQSLNKILLSEQPQIEARRLELVKSQGEYQALLRRLERDLLKALNESTGSILDDDVVIDTLERLKLEAAEIGKKVTEADGVMSELSSVTNKYAPAAESCCLIFAVLEQLATLQHFYQFSLRYFEDILETVLKQGVLGDQDLGERVAHIQQALYQTAYKRVCQSLLHKDHLTLALSLALVAHEHNAPAVKSLLSADGLMAKLPRTVEDVAQALAACKALPYSSRLASATEQEDMGELLSAETASDKVASLAESGEEWSLLLLVKHIRPDLLTRAAEKIVVQLLQLDISIVESGLAGLVSRLRPSTPIMLASVTGYDASFQVDQLVLKHGKICTSIAMGSAESIVLAERALTVASRTGGWILLKNVHLAGDWLSQLEKRVHALTAHNDFRLFLTTEMSLRVPASLIHNAQVVMCEPPPGMRANLLGSLKTVQGNGRAGQPPAERARLYVLLSWLHAVIQERLRFGKLGWSKAYEFNEADFESGLQVIDAWLQQASSDRSNIAPDKIPWLALQRLLSDSVYGGRIDEQTDQAQLDGLVQRLFSAKAYDLDFELVEGERIRLPETSQLDGFMQWITTTLPEHEPPTWLGLQADAERYMLAEAGAVTLKQVSLIMDADGLGI